MKTIKFRGRDDTGYPHYGDLTHEGKNIFVDDVCVDPDSVAQFVGYDQNGDEIYSDDRIIIHNPFKGTANVIGANIFFLGSEMDNVIDANLFFLVSEIGKTFDNVELLDKEKSK